MDAVISQALTEVAAAGAAGALGRSAGVVAGKRRARVIRQSTHELAERRAAAYELLAGLDELDSGEIIRYIGSPDFEQFAIQLTAMALEGRQPEKYIKDLRETLARSLSLHEAVPASVTGSVANLLFDELWASVSRYIAEARESPALHTLPGVAVSVSLRAAAAARNCQLLKRLETLTEFREFAQALRSQIYKVEGYIRPPRVEGGQRVPLTRLYLKPFLVRDAAEQEFSRIRRAAAEEVLADHLRVVVLGDPGGGKSTLSRWVACKLASGGRVADPFQVPFLAIMRHYAQFFEREEMPIARYLQVMVGGRYQIEAPADCVDFLLLNGHAVVILDGLDELLDTASRRRVGAAVEAFAHAYPATPMIVTSRSVGYLEAPLDPALFTAFRLDNFDADDVRSYARKWFTLDTSLPLERRRALAEAFTAESELVEDLRSNPLLLALMCALYRGDGYIPRNRLEIYERCAMLLFEGWDRQRGIHVPLPFEQHVRPAVCHLALWMYTDVTRQSGVTERELITALTRFLLARRFEDPDEAEAAAHAFAAYCRGRAWVLIEAGTTADGEPLFAFTHRTFLEFFAASQLTRKFPSADELHAQLAPHIRAQEWDAAAQLAVLLLERNVEAGADKFLTLLTRDAGKVIGSPQRAVCFSFAARLLSNMLPSPQVLREIFTGCWDLASSIDPEHPIEITRQNLASAGWLLNSQHDNLPTLAQLIRDHAGTRPHIGISPQLAVTLDQLVHLPDMRHRFPDALRRFWYDESIRNAGELRPVFASMASGHSWAAVEEVFAGVWSIENLVAVHGPKTVCEFSPWSPTYRRFPILVQAVLANHHFTWADDDQDRRLLPYIWLDPSAGGFTEALVSILPLSRTPWARLSRVVFWDVSVGEPSQTAPPGSAGFELALLCACMTFEARFLARGAGGLDEAEALPNWLRVPANHPLARLVRKAAKIRYEAATSRILRRWPGISDPVADLLDRWAARQIDLVQDDSSLTPMERYVAVSTIRALEADMTVQEACRRLGLNEDEIRSYLKSIYSKWKVNDQMSFVAEARRQGMLKDPYQHQPR